MAYRRGERCRINPFSDDSGHAMVNLLHETANRSGDYRKPMTKSKARYARLAGFGV